MKKTKQYYVSGDWAIASDGIQWMLQKKDKGSHWQSVIFISTDIDILERCMRERDVPRKDQLNLLSRLSNTFKEWQATNPTPDKKNALEKLSAPLKGILNDN